jgi:hypothetical protein
MQLLGQQGNQVKTEFTTVASHTSQRTNFRNFTFKITTTTDIKSPRGIKVVVLRDCGVVRLKASAHTNQNDAFKEFVQENKSKSRKSKCLHTC